jgi:hypothetical protein
MSTRPAAPVRRTWPGYLVALALAGAYSWWAATTTPFSIRGDVATAIPLAVLTAVALAQWRAARRGAALARPLQRLGPPGPATGATWPLPSVLAAALGWELYNFFSAPRSVHPTASSLYDAAASTQAWKAAFFLAWLALGWDLARR